MGDSKAATIYVSTPPRMVGKFPDNNLDELWVASIKACVPGGPCVVFEM